MCEYKVSSRVEAKRFSSIFHQNSDFRNLGILFEIFHILAKILVLFAKTFAK